LAQSRRQRVLIELDRRQPMMPVRHDLFRNLHSFQQIGGASTRNSLMATAMPIFGQTDLRKTSSTYSGFRIKSLRD
jgi:hypothetical protein